MQRPQTLHGAKTMQNFISTPSEIGVLQHIINDGFRQAGAFLNYLFLFEKKYAIIP